MLEVGLHFESLQFEEAAQGGKEVIGLSRNRLCGRLGQRDVLFKRLMVTLGAIKLK